MEYPFATASALFPYLQITSLHLGNLDVGPFRALLVTGILVGYFTLLRQARRDGLDSGLAATLSVSALLCGMLGAHWFKMAYEPQLLRTDPWLPIEMFNGMSSFGGIAGGLAGGAIFFWRRSMPARQMVRYLDVLAFAFLCAWIFGRMGCYVVHDHPGIRTNSWLAVRYPGGDRYDLGLLELLITPFFIALFGIVKRFRVPGIYVSAVLLLYPAVRLWIDTLHDQPPRYWGISVDQYASTACILAGLVILRGAVVDRLARVTVAREDYRHLMVANRALGSEPR